jgi:hypothetical protein
MVGWTFTMRALYRVENDKKCTSEDRMKVSKIASTLYAMATRKDITEDEISLQTQHHALSTAHVYIDLELQLFVDKESESFKELRDRLEMLYEMYHEMLITMFRRDDCCTCGYDFDNEDCDSIS